VACNMIICWVANKIDLQHPHCLIKTLMFKFIVECVENSAQYWNGIMWIENLLAILHLLLNLSCTLVCLLFTLNDLFQLLQGKFDCWAHSPVLLKFIAMLDISQTRIWTQYYVEYIQFYSLNQNLH
jgi:hypothetical protein